MPILLCDGIVTRYVNYRENDRIISIFTIDHGRVDAKARGCRKPTSALLPVCQPFVFGQFELYAGKDKYTVNQCQIKETFYPLREDYGRFSYASAVLQLAHAAAQENEPNEPLFSLLYHTLSFLAYGDSEPADLLAGYLIRFLNVIGYRPSITACARCGRDIRKDARILFSTELGGAVCAACAPDAVPVEKTALEAMRRMLLLSDDELNKIRLTEKLRSSIIPLLCGYAAGVLDYGARALASLQTETQLSADGTLGKEM